MKGEGTEHRRVVYVCGEVWTGDGGEGRELSTLIPHNVIRHHPVQYMGLADGSRIPSLSHPPLHQHSTPLIEPSSRCQG